MKEQAEAVQRMQDYIGEHRNETITLADLSRVSLFSPWHSYRLFKQWTGLTPSDYIRRLRLSTSALKLRDGQCRIADVAYEYGFGSVDGYQRAFCGNSAAIRGSTRLIRCPCTCSLLMESNTGKSERSRGWWKTSETFLFR